MCLLILIIFITISGHFWILDRDGLMLQILLKFRERQKSFVMAWSITKPTYALSIGRVPSDLLARFWRICYVWPNPMRKSVHDMTQMKVVARNAPIIDGRT